MTEHERDEILSHVAQNLISPLYWEGERKNMTAKEIYLKWSGEKFNELCAFVNQFVKTS